MSKGVELALLSKQNPNKYAIWDILGEDPNCNLGGHHHNPFLERVECIYSEAVAYALTLPNFIGWGAGGEIRMAQPTKKIDKATIEKRNKLLTRKKQLEDELKEVINLIATLPIGVK